MVKCDTTLDNNNNMHSGELFIKVTFLYLSINVF